MKSNWVWIKILMIIKKGQKTSCLFQKTRFNKQYDKKHHYFFNILF